MRVVDDFRPLPYDADRDLQYIGQFTSIQNVLAVRLPLPVKSVQELIAYARRTRPE